MAAPRGRHLSPSEPKIPRPPSLPKGLTPMDEEPPPPSRQSSALLQRLATLQLQRPLVVLLVALAVTIGSLALALRLEILTGFKNLLPEDRPSVIELDRVAKKTSGVSMIFVVLQVPPEVDSPPTESLRAAADAMVPKIRELGPPWVGSAESGVHEAMDFIGPRAGLFGEKEKLEELLDDIKEAVGDEMWDLGLDDEGEAEAEDKQSEFDVERVKESFGLDALDENRFPDGYYQSQDGRTVIVAVRSKVIGTDFENGTTAIRLVREVVDQTNVTSFDPRITYGLSGDLVTANAEYTAVNEDLTEVGYLGALLITAVVLLFYLRLRTLVTMLLTITVGVSLTFGATELFVGHLNLATGFLFTIVAGNGINPSIIYMARYLEARRNDHSLEESIRIAHRETWLPTLTASAAASAAYGSLLVTEFRGFRDFGLIGGIGMMLCWIATYWTLPSILVVIERRFPLEPKNAGWFRRLLRRTQSGVAYGRPFAALVRRAPRVLVTVGLLLAAAGVVLVIRYVQADPMEYDLKNLRSDETARAEQIRLSKLGDSITGHVGADGMAMLVDDLSQVKPLQDKLRSIRDAAPEGEKPFNDVHALQDFVPDDQEAKVPVVLEIRKWVLKARKRGKITDEDYERLEPFIPDADLKPFGMQDLPAGIARPFTESDGRRGRVVYISPTSLDLVDDAHYLFRWADSFRRTELPDGSVVLGSGRAVIYADMWTAVVSDVPLAVLFSFLATVLVVVIAFRGSRASIAVLGTLLVGVAWMALCLVLLEVRLNFLNFIALPITFGLGVDYSVNIVQRYVRDGSGSAVTAVQETGGAVVLCSLTTMLGYFALDGSMNFAVRSLGFAAMLGELCCIFAAVLVLPAALMLIDRKRPKGSDSFLSVPPPKGSASDASADA